MAAAVYSAFLQTYMSRDMMNSEIQESAREDEIKCKKKNSYQKERLTSSSWSEAELSEGGGSNCSSNTISFDANCPGVDSDIYGSPDGSSTPLNDFRVSKKPIPEDLKDPKYFERRRRNNLAAKKSRDARKLREDQVVTRVAHLEQENAILRAQVAMLRDEANILQIYLIQKHQTSANMSQIPLVSSQSSITSGTAVATQPSVFSTSSMSANVPLQRFSQYQMQLPMNFLLLGDPLLASLSSRNANQSQGQVPTTTSLEQSKH